MITTVTYRCLKCDKCGATYDNGGCDDEALFDSATQKGWNVGFKDYCQSCYAKLKGGKK